MLLASACEKPQLGHLPAIQGLCKVHAQAPAPNKTGCDRLRKDDVRRAACGKHEPSSAVGADLLK